MSTRMKLAVLALAAVILIVAGTSGAARQRDVWEYAIEYADSVGTLNARGQDGWELAAAYVWGNQIKVVMKRRKS